MSGFIGSFGGSGSGGGADGYTTVVNVGGDLFGTSASAVVTRIQGRAIKNAAPTDGQVLTYVAANSDWEPVSPSGGGEDADFGTYTCLSGATVGQVVYLSSTDTVGLANATDNTKIAIGIISAKSGMTTATVQFAGELSAFSGLVVGDIYYLDTTDGSITAIAPSNPGTIVQKIGTAKDSSTLVIEIDADYTEN